MTPVVLVAYNRPEALKKALESLAANDLAEQTDLFIRIDGPKGPTDVAKVEAVQEVARKAKGFRNVEVTSATENRGLACSVIAAVDRVLEISDTVIVVEDDLLVHPGFLTYMNTALEYYASQSEVWSVCGYSNRIHIPEGYGFDAYFGPRSSSWGWGTWRDRWQSVDWNPALESLQKNARSFNRWGGSDCAKMLRCWMQGRNQSWAIRFCYSQFIQGKTSLFPALSLVDPSAGVEGDGTNCHKYSRFKFDMALREKDSFQFPSDVMVVPSIRRSALRYHSALRRAWSRLMYLIYG